MKQKKMPACKCKAFDSHFEFQHEQRAIVACSDSGSTTTYRYENNSTNHLSKYRVDGGLIAKDEAKCDYLLLNCDQKKSFFIELKGSDLIRAVEQIDKSIDLLQAHIPDFAVYARIVLTRTNTIDLTHLKYLKLKKKVERLKGDLKKKNRLLSETF
jgi:hypothetical protein